MTPSNPVPGLPVKSSLAIRSRTPNLSPVSTPNGCDAKRGAGCGAAAAAVCGAAAAGAGVGVDGLLPRCRASRGGDCASVCRLRCRCRVDASRAVCGRVSCGGSAADVADRNKRRL